MSRYSGFHRRNITGILWFTSGSKRWFKVGLDGSKDGSEVGLEGLEEGSTVGPVGFRVKKPI